MTLRANEPATLPSLIETMRVEPGGIMPLLDGHLQRLRYSAGALGHTWPGEDPIRDGIAHVLQSLDSSLAWRVRLLLAPDSSVSIEHGPLAVLSEPLAIVVATAPRLEGANDWLQHKTTHRPWYMDATAWLARHPDIFDVLYWNADGRMCEGSRSNLYMQAADGRWLTPPLRDGALPGVQRSALLSAGRVIEASISREDFLQASARRISNALRGWRDVRIV